MHDEGISTIKGWSRYLCEWMCDQRGSFFGLWTVPKPEPWFRDERSDESHETDIEWIERDSFASTLCRTEWKHSKSCDFVASSFDHSLLNTDLSSLSISQRLPPQRFHRPERTSVGPEDFEDFEGTVGKGRSRSQWKRCWRLWRSFSCASTRSSWHWRYWWILSTLSLGWRKVRRSGRSGASEDDD